MPVRAEDLVVRPIDDDEQLAIDEAAVGAVEVGDRLFRPDISHMAGGLLGQGLGLVRRGRFAGAGNQGQGDENPDQDQAEQGVAAAHGGLSINAMPRNMRPSGYRQLNARDAEWEACRWGEQRDSNP